MSDSAEERLKKLGITLPAAPAPAANYVPYVEAGNLLFISGQVPIGPDGPQFLGTLGADISIEEGQEAARLCVLNLLAQAKAALGSLDRIKRCVKLGGFVASTTEFKEQHLVINGASNVMVDILGDAGRHARFAVGAPALPLGVSVEVDAVFEID